MDRPGLGAFVDPWAAPFGGALRPGARLGRYQLLLPIGQGGMARVWVARLQGDRGFSKLVALKTMLPHLAENADFEKMFLDEAQVAAQIQHPNVCALHELGEEGKVLFLVMEWVDGDSLTALLKPGPAGGALEPAIAARVIADACAGLHAAHESSDDQGQPLEVVHRDVTPQNILVSSGGSVKVTDFGIAKVRGQLHETAAGQIKGKSPYMAPEQIAGLRLDRRADVFALGCVLYEAVVGRPAFRGENDAQVARAVVDGSYEPAEEATSGLCPRGLAEVIELALARDRRARFQTADEMRAAVEEWSTRAGHRIDATQVGALVRNRLGPRLEQRRENVRAAAAALTMTSTRPTSRASAGAAPSVAPGLPARPSSLAPASTDTAAPDAASRPSLRSLRNAQTRRQRGARIGAAAALGLAIAVGFLALRAPLANRPSSRGAGGPAASSGGAMASAPVREDPSLPEAASLPDSGATVIAPSPPATISTARSRFQMHGGSDIPSLR